MVVATIYLDIEENDKVIYYSDKWNLSKNETIKRFIREYHQGKKMVVKK